MLQTIRDKVSGWIAVAIIILLIIPFAFWGINYYFNQGGNVNVVKVNGTKINLQQYQQAYQTVRQRWETSNKNEPLTPDQEKRLKQQTLDGLTSRELLNQLNASIGMYVGDRQVQSTIESISEFQGAKGFDKGLYESYVSQTGMSVPAFERQLRSDMISDQTRFGLIETEFMTDKEISLVTSLINQARDIDYAVLSSSESKEKTVVSDKDVQTYYQEHNQDFRIPEQVKIAYVDLSMKKLADAVQVSDSELKSYYNTNKANYGIEEQRSIKQIFIKIPDKNDKDTVAKAKSLADTLSSEIQSGSSMEDVVKKHGKDSGLDVEITDNEFLTKGILEQPVEDAVFKMEEGEISKPIETDTGVYIVKLTKITGGKTTKFENVRDQVEQDYRHNHAETQFFDLADKLASLSYENPDSLEPVSKKLNLEIYKSDFFSRDRKGDDLLSNPKIISASFSEDVLINGNNSEPIEVDSNNIVVLRVLEHHPEKTKPIEEVHDIIVTRIKYDRARVDTEKKGKQVIDDLKNNVPREQVAEKYKVQWKDAAGVRRDNKDIDPMILNSAFSAGRPVGNKPVYSGTSLASGDYAVIVVNKVMDNEKGTMTDDELKKLKEQLQQLNDINTWTEFMEDLKEKADIQVYTDNL